MKHRAMIAAACGCCAMVPAAQASLYQNKLTLTCQSGGACAATAAAVPAGKTLTIATVSCFVHFSGAASTGLGSVSNAFATDGFQGFVVNALGQGQTEAPTQSVPITFTAGKSPVVAVMMNSSTVTSAQCFLRGTLSP